ncbi:phosphatase PAP2 family protein [Streptacidiphilus sp. EB103A]|uniref:phosphatase PAP2 family protein n=1 Tax=Streptacidiphilus sp. EB103A TaxID=3156275 RepID=UPI003513FD06
MIAQPHRRLPLRMLTAALFLVGLVGLAALTTLTALVLARDGRPFGVDSALHNWVLTHRHPALDRFGVDLAVTGTGAPAYAIAALAGALATGTRRWWWRGALVGMTALALAELLRISLATAIARPRPPRADWLAYASGHAFPSGHTTTSALLAIGLSAALLRRSHRPPTRAAAVLGPALWAVAVGVDRVYLGVHWPTDVLAGWLLAALIGCALLTQLGALTRALSSSPVAWWPTRRWRPRPEPSGDRDA